MKIVLDRYAKCLNFSRSPMDFPFLFSRQPDTPTTRNDAAPQEAKSPTSSARPTDLTQPGKPSESDALAEYGPSTRLKAFFAFLLELEKVPATAASPERELSLSQFDADWIEQSTESLAQIRHCAEFFVLRRSE